MSHGRESQFNEEENGKSIPASLPFPHCHVCKSAQTGLLCSTGESLPALPSVKGGNDIELGVYVPGTALSESAGGK